jgi:hypothetical protein
MKKRQLVTLKVGPRNAFDLKNQVGAVGFCRRLVARCEFAAKDFFGDV